MTKITNTSYLRNDQYRDASNLNARAAIHQRFSVNSRGWFNWLLDQYQLVADTRILEVGAGPGYMWQQLRERLPHGCTLHLSDLSAGMLRAASVSIPKGPGMIIYAVADAQDLPFTDESFDLILANYMLYHVPDRPRALAEFSRLLRPDGRLYAATNGANHMRELILLGDPAYATRTPDSSSAEISAFSLENGSSQLDAFFPLVEVRRYEDGLRVTDPDAVLNYLLSMWEFLPAIQDKAGQARVRAQVEAAIAAQGAFWISKESGVFVAGKKTL